ncbi:MAG: zinc ribbon domain-containing protein [Clostridia bacterium]|nr:zinc ribbon domain-containing protein [Clostridia bacterium]
MYCKKCGRKVEKNERYCVECGTRISRISKYAKILIIVMIAVLTISLILGIVFVKSRDARQNDEAIYITQDSTVSPTGKEFIGEYSNGIVEYWKEDQKISDDIRVKQYDTSNEKIKAYSLEFWVGSYGTGRTKGFEEIFYYNVENNKLIGYDYITSSTEMTSRVLDSRNMTLDDFEKLETNFAINIFQNFLDNNYDKGRAEKYFDYWEKYMNDNNVQMKNTTINGRKCAYIPLGDVLKVCMLYNGDKGFEILFIAHDVNKNPEEEIENWLKSVRVIENIDQNNTTKNEGDSYIENAPVIYENGGSSNEDSNDSEPSSEDYTNWKMYFHIDEGTIFPYDDDACVVSGGAANYSDFKYVSYKKNPNSGEPSAAYSEGYALYFNNEKDTTHRYEFTNGENLTIKIVAPYLIEKSTGNVIGENVVIYEKTLSAKDWYKKSKLLNAGPFREVTPGLKSIWDE